MAAKNDILRDKDGNQIFPATMAEQVSYDGKINVKQAIKRGAVRNKVAPTVASMTDKEQIYVYTGTEEGYTFGNWYYWDGTAWTSGGAYNAIEVNTDGTLTEEGTPADAKATGLRIDSLKDDLGNTKSQLSESITDIRNVEIPKVSADLLAEKTRSERKDEEHNERLELLENGGFQLSEPFLAEEIKNWLDKHPEATTTVLDGSLGDVKFTDELKTKSIKDYVTPQMFGALGDGIHDDTQAIQYCLDNYDYTYIPNGNYKISGLCIDGHYKRLECDGNLISSNSIIVVNSSYSVINLNGFNECENDGIILDLSQKPDDDNFNIQFNTICAKNLKFNKSRSGKSAVKLSAKTAYENGIYCNEFSVERIISASTSDGIGISIEQSGKCYINENTFNKSSIMRCSNSIKMDATNSSGLYSMNGNVFESINPETSTIAINIIGNVSLSKFNNFRTLEFADSVFLNIDGEAVGNRFSFLQPLRVTSVNVKNNSRTNILCGEIHDRSGNSIYTTGEILLKGKGGTDKESYTLIQTIEVTNKAVYVNADTVLNKSTTTGRYINKDSVFIAGSAVTSSPVLTLSDDFGYGYIDKIRVYAPANKPVIKVKDSSGNVLLDKNICNITYMYTIEWVGDGLVTVDCAISDRGTDNANNPKNLLRKLEFTADTAPTTDDALISLLNANNALISVGSTIIDVYNGQFCYATMFVTKVNNNAAVCKVISCYSTNDKTYRYSSGSWYL